MNKRTFEKLTYECGWNGKAAIDWFDRTRVVDLVVCGEADEKIEDAQCESYEKFMEAWARIKDTILARILDYYTNLQYELGYSDNSNANYPKLSTADEMKDKVSLDSIVVPLAEDYDGRSIALAFHCAWDSENGLGVVLVNEDVYDIGCQDIVF